MTAKKAAISSLRKRLIASAPKPEPNRAWWAKLPAEELYELKELCREREIEGSEINRLYPSRISLARFLTREIATSIAPRTALDFIERSCRE